MSTMLGQGLTDQALSGIESFWSKLSDTQKADVQALLKRYGYSYEED